MRKLHSLLLFALLIFLLTACSSGEEEKAIEIAGFEPGEQTEYVFENDKLKLTFDALTTHFSVEKKTTGEVWYSNPVDYAEDTIASTAYKSALQSTMLVNYTTKNGDDNSYNNYAYSIENGLYEFEILENGVKINYTIGDVEKTYIIPIAVPESRMNEFMVLMERKGQRTVEEYYRKIDINKLRVTDDKSELLELYPDLEKEPVYVIRDGLQDHLKKKLEELFATVGYTFEDYTADSERYSQDLSNEKPIFNIPMLITIEDEDLVVSVPLSEVEYKEKYPLIKITPLPYFGCGGLADTGYLMVPDGSGALINFNNGKTQQNPYYNTVYGWDYAQTRKYVVTENSAYYPVFGISKNNSSFVCILEDGCSYAAVNADISGRFNSYNYANATYQVLHYEDMDVSAKSQKTIRVFETEFPSGQLVSRYRFLDSNRYDDMAFCYRDYLTRRHPELMKNESADVGLTVEILGAIDYIKQKFGVPTTIDYPLTTYKEAQQIIEELRTADLSGLFVKYNGWFNRGITHKVPTSVKLVSKLGGEDDFKSLVNYLNQEQIPLYLEANVTQINRNSLFDGFVAIRDGAKYANREVAEVYPYWPTTFVSKEDDMYLYYLAKPSYTLELVDSLMEGMNEYGVNRVSFSDLGKTLSSDYNRKNLVTREQVRVIQENLLSDLKQQGTDVMVYTGNDYCLPYVDRIVDMKLDSAGMSIIDVEVPFYQIALHGLVEFTGEAVNLAGNQEKNFLKTVETGAGLYFVVMKDKVNELQETEYAEFFGTEYDLWKDDIISMYRELESNFAGLNNLYITRHEILAKDVALTEYEDGTRVIVNYQYDPYIHDGVTIPARDYYVERGK